MYIKNYGTCQQKHMKNLSARKRGVINTNCHEIVFGLLCIFKLKQTYKSHYWKFTQSIA